MPQGIFTVTAGGRLKQSHGEVFDCKQPKEVTAKHKTQVGRSLSYTNGVNPANKYGLTTSTHSVTTVSGTQYDKRLTRELFSYQSLLSLAPRTHPLIRKCIYPHYLPF